MREWIKESDVQRINRRRTKVMKPERCPLSLWQGIVVVCIRRFILSSSHQGRY